MRTITLLVLLLSIKQVNGQQGQFDCYELIEKKKGNFEKYLKKIPLLTSGFVYKEWMPLILNYSFKEKIFAN
jgi:hypothetical protein